MKTTLPQKILIVLVLLLGFFLRFYKIAEVPPSLNWDEVSIGYNAYSILKTGKDEWGEKLPLHFKSYGEYKLPTQIYASIPGIYFFGLNPVGLRITPVVYGTLTILLVYFLARKISKNYNVGIAAAFFVAISPWHIQLTRASFESSFSVFWVVLGILLLVEGLKKHLFIFISMICFAIAVYTYNSARVFVPLFILSTLVIYRNKFLEMKKQIFFALVLFSVLMIPLIPFVVSGKASARYKLVSITNEAGLIPRINERRGATKLPAPFPRLIHNKVTYISFYFVRNYLAHFTPNFLFLSGAGHRQHHVQGVGEMYIFQLPFVLMGLVLIYKNRYKHRHLLSSWILLAFIPVATTGDSIPNALRTVIAMVPYQIISAIGLVKITELLKGEKIRIVFLIVLKIVIILSILKFTNILFNLYPKLYSKDWQYGNREVVSFIKENYDKYDLIVYTRHYGEPHMFTLFYLGWDPSFFQSDQKLVRFETFDWIRVLNFDKFYFPDLGDKGTGYTDIIDQNPDKKILFIGKPGDFPQEVKQLKTIKFLDQAEAFEIVTEP